MQDVNDDMDELFKRAAESYPLNTNSGDWNEVYKALPAIKEPLHPINNKKGSRRFLWLLLLLLPFIIVVPKYIFNSFDQNTKSSTGKKAAGRSAALVRDNGTDKKETITGQNNSKRRQPENDPGQTDNLTILGTKKYKNENRKFKITALPIVKPSVSHQSAGREPKTNTPVTLIATTETSSTAGDNETTNQKSGVPAMPSGPTKSLTPSFLTQSNSHNLNPKAIGSAIPGGPAITTINTTTTPDTVVKSEIHHSKSEAAAPAGKTKNKPRHLYAGVLGGPDFSTIKMQKIVKTGITGGVTVGYQLNKKWSIESGLYLDNKYYYTQGKYFSTKKIPIPYYIKIENADGDCKMIELPLNVKYDFKPTKNGSWFALAGITSYLMKKEDYEYRLLSNYGQRTERKVSYKNSTKDWASVVNLSAGYGFYVGKTWMFRIEPYIKIPFRGIGIGSLPLTSSGVHLGLTKNIF